MSSSEPGSTRFGSILRDSMAPPIRIVTLDHRPAGGRAQAGRRERSGKSTDTPERPLERCGRIPASIGFRFRVELGVDCSPLHDGKTDLEHCNRDRRPP
jgi:hypothetical protein